MPYSWIVNALPFWILGVPLVIAILNYLGMPRQSELVPPDRRQERRSIAREEYTRAGDTAVTKG